MHSRKGQTILEYTVILIIILGVMITMKDYVKRGIQGRWKSSTDDMGEQYDPQSVNSEINYSTQSNSTTVVQVINAMYQPPSANQPQEGQWTNRIDSSNSLETKTGFTQVGD